MTVQMRQQSKEANNDQMRKAIVVLADLKVRGVVG